MDFVRVGLIGTMACALLLHSGCSFLFVHGPPADHARVTTFECSESNAWPVVDVIWAGLNGLGAASAAGDDKNPQQGQIVGVGIAWLVVSGISAIYGFGKVSTCKDAKRARDERYLGRGVVPIEAPSAAGASPRGPAAAPALAPTPSPGAATPATAAPARAPARAAPAASPPSATPGPANPAPPVAPAPGAATTPVPAPPRASRTAPSSTPGATQSASGPSGSPPARRSLAMRLQATAD
jgi:hypothetical protein